MNNELKAPYDVVIVGSGYSGTMVAVHLARAQREFIPTVVVPPLLVTHGLMFWLLLRKPSSTR
jgi:NADH dehydrogenase FAD-containing subunit